MTKKNDTDVEAVKKKLLTRPKTSPIPATDFLSTGATTLNLGLTGKPNQGFAKGHIYLLVGDSSSGKTFVSMTCLAEAALNRNFKDYRFIQDIPEAGALMDVGGFFGQAVAKRLEPPAGTRNDPEFSYSVEQHFRNVQNAMKKGPCIYLTDSMDALFPEADLKKLKKDEAKASKGQEAGGSYGMEKAKAIRAGMRMLMGPLQKTGSILIYIFQTTQRVGFGAQLDPKTKAGGTAPTFFATHEIWSSVKCPIKKKVRDKWLQIGAVSKIKIKKNRVAGRPREVDIPFLYTHGFDDIGGMCDYLLEWGHWTATEKKEQGKMYMGKIVAPEWNLTLKREDLINHIEEHGLEMELRAAVTECWNQVEAECAVQRKSRYT